MSVVVKVKAVVVSGESSKSGSINSGCGRKKVVVVRVKAVVVSGESSKSGSINSGSGSSHSVGGSKSEGSSSKW